MSYAEFHGEHIRLSILRLLDGMGEYTANDSVLHQGVNSMGLSCSRDTMRNHLSWLAEQGLIRIKKAGTNQNIIVATITERGSEIGAGVSTVPGVQRPSPK